MYKVLNYIQGDKAIWGVVILLAIFSFMPVYSASTNLVYNAGGGSTLTYLLRHGLLLILGVFYHLYDSQSSLSLF